MSGELFSNKYTHNYRYRSYIQREAKIYESIVFIGKAVIIKVECDLLRVEFIPFKNKKATLCKLQGGL